MGNDKVWTHISKGEYACKHCGLLPPTFYGEASMPDYEFQTLFRIYESIREGRGGRPLAVNSGYRCEDYEREMFESWVQSGKQGEVQGFISAHLFGLALDLRADDWDDHAKIVELARKASPLPRIGWKQYKQVGSLIVHIDLGYLVTPLPSRKWMRGVEW